MASPVATAPRPVGAKTCAESMGLSRAAGPVGGVIWPYPVTRAPHAATVALAVSLHGPGVPLVAIQRVK